jgi:pyruvate kinase
LNPGQLILISDGLISCEVLSTQHNSITVKVLNNGSLGSNKNLSIPGHRVKLPSITEQDEEDIQDFALFHNVDYLAVSYIRSVDDVRKIRKLLGSKANDIKIISKIENEEGLMNFEEILKESDGIMIARGYLGMDIPSEKIFIAQKYMIDMANIAGKPVITATQLMESMTQNPRPTRAESTDVANAVLDGSDCLMLSGETADGLYPTKTIEIMNKICIEAENMINYKSLKCSIKEYINSIQKISKLEQGVVKAVDLAELSECSLIVTFTKNGRIAELLSKYRPQSTILAYW